MNNPNETILIHQRELVKETAKSFAKLTEWDTNAALDLCIAILTETNWHTLASKLEAEAEKEIEDELQAEARAEDLFNASL